MSEQATEPRESAAARRARVAREQAEQPNAEQPNAEQPNAEQPTEPDLDRLATLNPDADDLSDEDRAAFAGLDDKQRERLAELREIASIKGFSLAANIGENGQFRKETTPVRNRKPVQLAMDAVAAQAYTDWVEADRPSTWSRMPVITYFLAPEDVADYRKMIRAAVLIVPAQSYQKDGKTVEPSGVRARFGKEFVLTEKMANKIGKPSEAGKTVLAWAAIDKRNVTDTANGDDD